MIESHPQETLLIKFADRQTTPTERAQAIALVQTDKSAAKFLTQLQQTELPIPNTIDIALEPVESNTIDLVNTWQPVVAQSLTFGVKTISLTLIAGLVTGYLLTSLIKTSSVSIPATSVVDKSPTPEWIKLVADYHRLYSRETIVNAAPPMLGDTNAVVSEWLGRETNIPVLNDKGIIFKRAQQLTVESDTLVQLAYLPDVSDPVAICIRKTTATKNTDTVLSNYNGMQYAQWQDDKHAVVIVGNLPEQQLRVIAREVRETLFGRV